MRSRAFAVVIVAALVGGACDISTSPPIGKVEKSEKCATCHMEDYENARNHVGKRPPTCEICHTQKAWHEKHLDHPFALTGKHETTDCFDCHTGKKPKFEGTPKKCFACHEADFEKENERKAFHKENGTECENCHLTSGWADWTPEKKEPPHPPPPEPTSRPTALPTATATATATAIATSPQPTQKPIPRPNPTPRPIPTPVPTPIPTPIPTPVPTPVPTKPDIVTRPSQREG
jgi:hypothetical protein